MKDQRIRSVAPGDLKPYPKNARTHSKKQIRQIADSIREFGWINPVLVDGDGGIIAGHGRVEAAKLLGMESVPTLLIDHLTDEQKRAYILADNRLAELAGWDVDILATELQFLTSIDLDFDVSVIGFETAEIDLMIESLDPEDDEAEEVPGIDKDSPPVSRLGDLWLLGPHRLLCGDARDPASYDKVMGEERARMVFTDPPYNVAIDGHVCGLGSVKHREFEMAAGEMSEAEFTAFLKIVLTNMADVSLDGALHYVCMDWRHAYELTTAGREVYAELKNLCVWNKTNGGMGSLYRSKHELVFVFKAGTAAHVNNIELGRYGRNRTNVWDYAGVNSLRRDRLDELKMHPTVKPVRLVADAIKDASRRGEIVLDPFCGSGTTIIAAEKTGRRAYGLELDPHYVDTAVRRWETLSGEVARHAETECTFEETKQRRLGGSDPMPGAMGREEVDHVR